MTQHSKEIILITYLASLEKIVSNQLLISMLIGGWDISFLAALIVYTTYKVLKACYHSAESGVRKEKLN